MWAVTGTVISIDQTSLGIPCRLSLGLLSALIRPAWGYHVGCHWGCYQQRSDQPGDTMWAVTGAVISIDQTSLGIPYGLSLGLLSATIRPAWGYHMGCHWGCYQQRSDEPGGTIWAVTGAVISNDQTSLGIPWGLSLGLLSALIRPAWGYNMGCHWGCYQQRSDQPGDTMWAVTGVVISIDQTSLGIPCGLSLGLLSA